MGRFRPGNDGGERLRRFERRPEKASSKPEGAQIHKAHSYRPHNREDHRPRLYRSALQERLRGPPPLKSMEDIFLDPRLLSEGKFSWLRVKQETLFPENISTYEDYMKAHQRFFFDKFLKQHQQDSCWQLGPLPSTPIMKMEGHISYKFDPEVFGGNPSSSPSDVTFDVEYPASLASFGLDYHHGLMLSNIPPTMSLEELTKLLPSTYVRLNVSLPDPSKQFHRFAWAHFNKETASLTTSPEFTRALETAGIYCAPSGATFVHKAKVSKIKDPKAFLTQLRNVYESFNPSAAGCDEELGMDFMLDHMRRVNHFCGLCESAAGCSEELIQRCGNVHLYILPDSDENQIGITLDYSVALCALYKSSILHSETNSINDILVKEDVKQLEPEKFQCRLCEKPFRGSEFVVKHLHGKHGEHIGDLEKRLQNHVSLSSRLEYGFLIWPRDMVIGLYSKGFSGEEYGNKTTHQYTKRSRPYITPQTYKDWDAVKLPSTTEEISYD